MIKEHYPPQEIIDLFETEELASHFGRPLFLEWVMNLDSKLGDKVFLPEVGGGGEWFEQGPRLN